MPRRKKGRTLAEIVALLKDPAFCVDTRAVHQEAVRQLQTAPSRREWDRKWPEFANRVVVPFVRKWGALPPEPDLVETDPRQEPVFAILTGRWGLIPVFPWTTHKEIERRARRIRQAIGKVHKDTKGRQLAGISAWLRLHTGRGQKPPPRSEIAAAVWGRRKGLRRATVREAIRRLPEAREQELIDRYLTQGLHYQEAQRRLYRRARGTEAPAAAMVRTAEKRHERERQRFMAELQSPRKADPLGHALTALLQEIISGSQDLESIRRKTASLRDLLITPSRLG